MPLIDDFRDHSGRVDVNAWRHDIIEHLLVDMSNGSDGLSGQELCVLYFGHEDYENREWLGHQMQQCRHMLINRNVPLLLRSHNWRWYIIKPGDQVEARAFLVERAKRLVRDHIRLEVYAEVAQATYALPSGDPLLRSIASAEPSVRAIEGETRP